MWKRLGAGTALLTLLAMGAVPGETQERPERAGEQCVCVLRSGAPEGGETDRCRCVTWPDTLLQAQLQKAMARIQEDLGRAQLRLEVDREQVHQALVRAREAMERIDLDTLHVFRHFQPSVRLGLEFSPRPVETRPGGVRVVGVTRGSGAEEAGLLSGDVIEEVNGHDLSRPLPDERLEEGDESPPAQRLRALTADLEEGDTVRIVYLRGGERRTAEVEARRLDPWRTMTIRAFPGEIWEGQDLRLRADTILVWPPRAPSPPGVWAPWTASARFGLRLMDLNPDLGAYFDRDEGVLVLEVRDDAPLEFRAGDVILRIDGREVEDARHATAILQSYRSGEEIRVEVLRRGRTEGVEGRVP